MTESNPLPPGRELIADAVEWKGFVEELKLQWKTMWRERIDDKVRAEGIARNDFELLFVDRGTVIVATRLYKQLEFKEILEEYQVPYEIKIKQQTPSPNVGGWRKFGRKVAAQRSPRRSRRDLWSFDDGNGGKRKNQQQKKCGRGWLHFRNR